MPHYRKTDEDATEELARNLKRVVRYLLARHSLNRYRSSRFVDKSQVFTVRVSLINELLRDHNPKFVLITRNPYASCYRAAMGKAGDMKRYKNHLSFEERLELCTQHWHNSMEYALEDKKRIDNEILILQFEQILKSPHGKMKQLCDFVELEFGEDMLPQPDHKIPLGTTYRNRWYPLRPEVNQKYLSKITKEEIKVIEKRCGELASQFGYYPLV